MLEAADAIAHCMAQNFKINELESRERALREALQAQVVAMREVLEAAYHRHFAECCGRPWDECCGSPIEAWSADDLHILNTLGPAEKQARAALAQQPEREG